MMRIIPRGADTFLFRDGSHASVGWLRGHTVRFTGFPSHRDTVAAAVQGTLAVTAYVRGTTLHTGPSIARPPDRADRRPTVAGESARVWLKHEGGHEWVFVDGNAVARLVSPPDAGRSPHVEESMACNGRDAHAPAYDSGAFALDFVLSPNVSVDARLALAQVLHAAVRYHRARLPARAG